MTSPTEPRTTRVIAVLCELWCWLGPLLILAAVVRLTAARHDSFLREVTAEVLNLQLAALVPTVLGVAAALVGWNTAAFVLWAVFALIIGYGYVVGVVGAVRAWRGDAWSYPVNLRIVSR